MILLVLLLAQPLELTADAKPLTDAGAYAVGAPFRLIIEAKHAPGEIAVLPESLDLGSALGERLAVRRLLRSDASGKQIDRYELELIAFESGTVTIPAIPLALGSTTASTLPITLDVVSSLDEEIRPVAASTLAEAMPELEKVAATDPDPDRITIPDYRPLGLIGALVLAALIAWAFMRWRRRENLEPAYVPPPRPAHELAIERLRALMQRPRATPEEQKAFYVDLSEIVRAYLGGRYGFDSLELTVDELFRALEPLETPSLDRAKVRRMLDTADLVKFAKLVTEDDEAVAHGKWAMTMVDATRPPPEPEVASK